MPQRTNITEKWVDQAKFVGTSNNATVSFTCTQKPGEREPVCVVTHTVGTTKTQEEKIKPFIGKSIGKLARRFKLDGSTVKPIEFYRRLRRDPNPNEQNLEM